FYDPNPVVMLEHKGLYWSKVKGTETARTIEPSEDYIIPLGKARTVQHATEENKLVVVTYGMGVHWAMNASKSMTRQVEIIDLRTLMPLDEEHIFEAVKKCGRCLVLTEEPALNGFAQSIAGRISEICFEYLDAPVHTFGSQPTPAIPLNSTLEEVLLPNVQKVELEIRKILEY
ncbi:MAG: transketolase C-terminal domain-containing protein, partial [Bacteroidota bacterium]